MRDDQEKQQIRLQRLTLSDQATHSTANAVPLAQRRPWWPLLGQAALGEAKGAQLGVLRAAAPRYSKCAMYRVTSSWTCYNRLSAMPIHFVITPGRDCYNRHSLGVAQVAKWAFNEIADPSGLTDAD
jgi:hypothetical protein